MRLDTPILIRKILGVPNKKGLINQPYSFALLVGHYPNYKIHLTISSNYLIYNIEAVYV